MKTKIIADSSCDIFTLDGVDFSSIPLSISTHERTFSDSENLDLDEMLDYLAAYHGRSYTSCPSIDSWINSFGEADIIFIVTITSALSGTYSSAVTASELYLETHPNAKVHVFDTLSAGPEVLLLTEKIAECVRAEKSFEETIEICNDYLLHTRVFFALESFHNFAQNGRINKVVAAAAGILNIRILATGSTKGEIEPIAKCRSDKNVVGGFMSCMEKAGYCGGKVYIFQCKNIPLAEKISAGIKENYPDAEIKISATRGLCSYYAEKGGILLSCECEKEFR